MLSVEPVVRVMQQLGASFALIGGHAVALRGFPRMTIDYDFLTTDRRTLTLEAWTSLDASVDIRKGDPDDPLAGVVHIDTAAGEEVDVIVGRWRWEQDIIDRAEMLDIGGLEIPVPHTSDLILLKLSAGGILDLQDVKVLLAVSDRENVAAEVDARIAQLDSVANDAWNRLRRE